MQISTHKPEPTCHVWSDPQAREYVALTILAGQYTETHYFTAEEALQLSNALLRLSHELSARRPVATACFRAVRRRLASVRGRFSQGLITSETLDSYR
jgi:hypothetical protein